MVAAMLMTGCQNAPVGPEQESDVTGPGITGPAVTSVSTTTPPAIDGQIETGEWSSAATVTVELAYVEAGVTENHTMTIRFLNDTNNLG